ncbi:MAG: hypothetical protein KDH19_01300 [Geminicoccaceae bacterium]|nr:hypothetical protein [Geminicoccaceae bacterium]
MKKSGSGEWWYSAEAEQIFDAVNRATYPLVARGDIAVAISVLQSAVVVLLGAIDDDRIRALAVSSLKESLTPLVENAASDRRYPCGGGVQ